MNVRQLICIAAAAFMLTACNKDQPVEILSLSKNGSKYYFGQQVVLWTAVDGDWKNTTYDWECTGGGFNNGPLYQHLRENCWIAPDEPGEYFVTVTAKTDKQSDTRKTRMLVTNYYRYEFDGLPGTGQGQDRWVYSGSAGEYALVNDETVALFPSTSSSADGYIGRNNFSTTGLTGGTSIDPPLMPPFSIRTKMMYTRYREEATNVTTAGHATRLALQFVQPTGIYDKPFVREIRLEFIPVAGANPNWRLRFERFTPSLNQSVWSTNNPAPNEPGPLFFGGSIQGYDPIFELDPDQYHTFTFTMERGNRLTIWIDGNKWLDGSAAINEYLVDNGLELTKVNWFRIYAPRNVTTTNTTLPLAETLWVIREFTVNNEKTAIGGDVNNIGFEDLK